MSSWFDSTVSNATQGAHITADSRSLEQLKQQAIQNPEKAVRQAARQFEAQFAQMLMQEMNKTSFLNPDDPLSEVFGQGKTDTWGSMLTQERAQQLAGLNKDGSIQESYHGLGLAPVIERQLNQQLANQQRSYARPPKHESTLELARASMARIEQAQQAAGAPNQPSAPVNPMIQIPRQGYSRTGSAVPSAQWLQSISQQPNIKRIQNGQFNAPRNRYAPALSGTTASVHIPLETGTSKMSDIRDAFVQKFLPAARRAEQKTGIPAHYILGQAALESGWGKREIRSADGKPTFNVFGIKATGWKGAVSHNMTTEFHNGTAQRVREGFRAYNSYDHAFEDYARLLANSPRYSKVVQSSTPHEFAYGLQKAGYATDPQYGSKVLRMIDLMMGKPSST